MSEIVEKPKCDEQHTNSTQVSQTSKKTFNIGRFKKCLSNQRVFFPSQLKKRKHENIENQDDADDEEEEEDEEDTCNIEVKNKQGNSGKKSPKNEQKNEQKKSTKDTKVSSPKNKEKQFSLIFYDISKKNRRRKGGGGDDDDDDEDEDDEDYEDDDEDYEEDDYDEDEESETEDEDASVSSVDSEDIDEDYELTEEQEEDMKKEMKKDKVYKSLAKQFQQSKNKKLKSVIETYETQFRNSKLKQIIKDDKTKEKYSRIFKRAIKQKPNSANNDFTYFRENYSKEEQYNLIKKAKELKQLTIQEKPYRITLLERDIPSLFKAHAMKRVQALKGMDPCDGEYHKIKNWVDTFMKIPFGNYVSLPVTIDDGVEKCNEFMENARKILDSSVYGLNDAKMQIMQILGQLISNPTSTGTAIAIHGDKGVGKTSIVKEGISKILNRPFAFIPLGGATDSSYLEGHSFTYEGSMWGKIVQIIIDSKVMNPVIYFDELDKISDTPKGDEIVGILTHLTDTSQNMEFHDKYFSDIHFDLSKCIFIFSYNDETKINPILRDRMYRIFAKGYDRKEKTVIARDYLLPKILKEINFTETDLIITDEVIGYVIEKYGGQEVGVRNLKRCIEVIYTKLNLCRLMKPGTKMFDNNVVIPLSFPFTITKEVIDKLITIRDNNPNQFLHSMYL